MTTTTGSGETQRYVDQHMGWSRALCESTAHGALFDLCLSFFDSNVDLPPAWHDIQGPPLDANEQIENHYPAQPLSADATNWQQSLAYQSKLLAQGFNVSAKLHAVMHPEPLCHKDAPLVLDDPVIENTVWRTQRSLLLNRQAVNNSSAHKTDDLPLDATKLADIVEQAKHVL